jgi:hypothetical protein
VNEELLARLTISGLSRPGGEKPLMPDLIRYRSPDNCFSEAPPSRPLSPYGVAQPASNNTTMHPRARVNAFAIARATVRSTGYFDLIVNSSVVSHVRHSGTVALSKTKSASSPVILTRIPEEAARGRILVDNPQRL